MRKGDVVQIPFPFTDLSGSKIRPAVVLAASTTDVTLAFVTSQLQHRQPYDVLLTAANHTGLKIDSLIRTAKIATLDRRLVRGRMGTLSASELVELDAGLRLVFGL